MAETQQYIVTRGGREVLRGDESALLNAARAGKILSNDLVYDDAASSWSFARSLLLLRGFPLRERLGQQVVEDADQSVIDTGRRLFARRRLASIVLRLLGVFAVLSLLATLLFLIPDTKKNSTPKKLESVLEPGKKNMKIEGSGSGMTGSKNTREGSSNMDLKGVVVDGEEDDTMENDEEGRKAALLLTPEQAAALGGDAVTGSNKNSEAEPVLAEPPPSAEEPMSAAQLSPSIPAAAPPSSVVPVRDSDSQPLVLIRPKMESLKLKADDLSKETTQTLSDDAFREVASAAKAVERDLEAAKEDLELNDEFTKTLQKIRAGLVERCIALEESKRCQLIIEHPSWSPATLDAILRSDVILGMTKAQVEASKGQPVSKREAGPEAVWCFDEACEQNVEFRKGRVLKVVRGVVKASEAIETPTTSSSPDQAE